MNTKFTPGPWSQSHRKDKSGGYSTEVYDSNGETICTLDWYVVPTEKGFTTNRDENARLIACAPDMYDTLETIKRHILNMPICDPHLYGWVEENIDPLLKRAMGE